MMDNTILKQFLADFNNGYFIKVGNKTKQLFIGKDDEGRYCFEFRGKFIPVKLIGSMPLIVNQYKLNETENILRFSLEREELIGCFSSFCEDLITSAELDDDNAVYRALSNRYQAWKKLFKPNHRTLFEYEVMGLIGELLFYRKLHLFIGEKILPWKVGLARKRLTRTFHTKPNGMRSNALLLEKRPYIFHLLNNWIVMLQEFFTFIA